MVVILYYSMGCTKSIPYSPSTESKISDLETVDTEDKTVDTDDNRLITKCQVSLFTPLYYDQRIPIQRREYEEYVKMRIEKKKRQSKKYNNKKCDIPKMLNDGECVMTEMRKIYSIPSYIFDAKTYLCIIAGWCTNLQKILFISGRLNGRHNLELISITTKEHLLIWWHSGLFENYHFYIFLSKLLIKQIGDKYSVDRISEGIYTINIHPSIRIDSTIWKLSASLR